MPELSEAQFARLATQHACKPIVDKHGNDTGQVLTGVVRLQFADLVQPDQKGKYKCVLIFHPDSDISALKAAAIACAEAKWGDKWKTLLKQEKSPFKSQSRMTEKFDGFYNDPNAIYVNCGTQFVPKLYASNGRDELTPSADTLYSGAYVRATLRPYTYEPNKAKDMYDYGISLGLQGLQFIADGKRLGGGVPMSDYLEPISIESDDRPPTRGNVEYVDADSDGGIF